MHSSRFLLPLMLLSLLGGCASLEQRFDKTRSDTTIAIPVRWDAPTPTSAALAPDELARWWTRLADPTLDTLVATALNNAPDIRSAQAKLRQSRAAQALAVANLAPSLDASASSTRALTGLAAGGSGTPQTLHAAGFDASWEPSIFGGLRDAAAGARADADAMAASLAATQVSLAAEVATQYVTLRASQRRLAIAQANVISQDETLQIAVWREMAGLVTALDVEQARTNLAQTRATIPSLESSRAGAEHRLALLTGQPPATLRQRLAIPAALPEVPTDIAVGIPTDTLRQRPDVQAAELTLKAEIARSMQREADRLPSLSLSGSFGWQATGIDALTGGTSAVRSLAASLAGNLFDGGRIRSRLAAQRAVEEQALIAWEKSLLTALEDVENALTSYRVGRTRVDARRQAADAAGKAAQLARTQYQAGIADFQKVLETERTRLSAEDSLASAEADLLNAVVQLYKALGGGWQTSQDSSDRPS
ncbi:efflux transporter outer membrane subunit [Propionivibrio dicarboxylicus]|uniref:Efflux transporter, outer membrane factor (OMF) lipoprotein, NodT family n=1 Tax=Propionivibrio dicarboxylicus TaxID=83767 RepID=A0A1G7VPJ7_9RHOO|nr:efflux transporter outer membrane subunit [Propionivibrio dicarboxylicus]SDG61742.1 efflux transporter, outer membrane factor (OMF) lipoprotein, NodT family [Propionivibrio dicarboxylicus]